MGIFDRFRKKGHPSTQTTDELVKSEKSLQELKKTETKVKSGETKVALKEDTGTAYRVLLKPIVTEKAAILADIGQYVFEVSPRANKIEVAKAVKSVYGVNPVRVNLIRLKGQEVSLRYKRLVKGRRKNKIKAVVTLKKGEKISLFEGV